MTAQRGFAERLSLADAWAWLNSCPVATGSEPVTLRDAIGRVLSTQLMFPADRPDRDLALVDGHAVQAESTLGASVYNPLFLTLVPEGVALTAGRASSCNAGDALPPGADAVLPLEIGEAVGSVLEVCDGIARGAGVGAKGQAARFGDVAVAAGRRLEAPQIALAASLGVAQFDRPPPPRSRAIDRRGQAACKRGSRRGAVRPGRAGWRHGALCTIAWRHQADACRPC